jgi:hypothetical protein
MDKPTNPPPPRKQPIRRENAVVRAVVSVIMPLVFGVQDKKTQEKNQEAPAPTYLDFHLKMNNIDLGKFERDMNVKLPMSLTGRLSFDVQASVPVNDPSDLKKYKAAGNAQVKGLVLGDNVWKLDFLDTEFALAGGTLRLPHLQGRGPPAAGLPAGSGAFSAAGQLDIVAPYAFNGQFKLQNIDIPALERLLPGVQMPVAVKGIVQASASLKGTAEPLRVQGDVDLQAPYLRIQNVTAEELQGTVVLEKSVIHYRLKGKSFGGTFELEGDSPQLDTLQKTIKQFKSHLKIRDVQIHRLMLAFGAAGIARAAYSRLNLDLDFVQRAKDGLPEGTGLVRLTDLRYQDQPLAAEITSQLILSGPELRLRNVSADSGQGLIHAQAALNVERPEQSWFTVNLDSVEASRLLGPWLGNKIKGPLEARIRGRGGPEWFGEADIALRQGNVFGLNVSDWHVPLRFVYAPSQQRGEVNISQTTAQAGHGQITGNAAMSWDGVSSGTVRLQGKLLMSRVDVQTLLRQAGSSPLGGGLMTARFDFGGQDMRTIYDLTGTLHASFAQTQALNVPVLHELSPFLGIGNSTTFQKGSLSARLERGLLKIDALALEAVNYSVFIDGTVTLRERLDLDVVAHTGNLGIGTPRLRLLGIRIPIAGPVPLVVAQEVASLLANRVVHARVTGTVQSPTIRVVPLATLTQEGARFFVMRALGTSSSGSLSAIP